MKRLILALCLALSACEDEEATDVTLHAKLDLEIRDTLTVDLAVVGDDLTAKIELSNGHGLAPANRTLKGIGHVEHFPEAGMELYTARFSVKGDKDGPCGDDYVSLALALHQRGKEPRLSGSLTAYCGAYTYSGIPARNPLRVATPAPGSE